MHDFDWWLKNILLANRSILLLEMYFALGTDVSEEGWGGTERSNSTRGRWKDVQNHHIDSGTKRSV